MKPDEVCAKKVRESGSSFYYSFKVLSAEKRRGMYALYAFCRQADDIADEGCAPGADLAERVRALDAWQAEFERCCEGRPTHPITTALREKMDRFRIPRQPFDRIIEGVRMDLAPRRYETFQDLREYCSRVAGAPGIASIHVLGYHNETTPVYAENLGLALQLTNILRDVGQDADAGRVYFPAEDLERFGCDPADLVAKRETPAFLELMRFQCERAHEAYEAARRSLAREDRRAMLCPQIMAAIYRALLAKIERSGFDTLTRRIALSTPRKLAIALAACVRATV